MTEIIVGERVLSKFKETGTIVSFDGKTIVVQYENRVAKLQPDAFEKGFITYEKTELQSEIDESIQQSKNAIEKEAEEKRLAAQKANEACRMMEAKAPVGVKFNSVSIRLEPAPVSLASVKKKHKDTVQKIFNECDEDIGAFYDAFKPNMKYITPPPPPTRNYGFLDFVHEPKDVRPSYYRSRYCAGFLTKYSDTYVIRVFSRNDVYTPGRYGGFTVTNSDTTEIIRAICIDGELYCFSKHLTCDGGKYKNSNLYKKWQASSYLSIVILDEVIRKCDCKYLNDYICQKEVVCQNYAKLLAAALCDNKSEIIFKNGAFSSIADVDNIIDHLKNFTPKQIDFATKNNVIKALPVIKECGLFDVEILKKITVLMNKRNGNSTYDSLVQLFIQHNFDLSLLNQKLITFLRNNLDFNFAIYGDYISEIFNNPNLTIDDVFDKDYERRHVDMQREKEVRCSKEKSIQYIQAAQELSWIDREENGYHIIIPKTIAEFRDEGQQQHNCVFTMQYFNKVIYKHSIIVFLRKDKNTSFVTIEYDYETFDVMQANEKYNQRTNQELYDYIVDLGKRLYFERLSHE